MSKTRKKRLARQRKQVMKNACEVKLNFDKPKILVFYTMPAIKEEQFIETQSPVLLKTLIVFDTNSLRSTDAGAVAYSFFKFGQPFQVVEEFILENRLSNDIHIAVPNWAIEELKDQKERQYKLDIVEFKKLAQRLSGLPHIGDIILNETEFDCTNYVKEKALEYLSTKKIKFLEIKEEVANTVLQSMMNRVMKDEALKTPFVHAKKGNKTYKDAGFKDNLIWESLLHFQEISNYDKVIFLTNDSDYNNACADEFKGKWNKHIVVLSSDTYVKAEIQRDYGNYIEEREIHDFARTEYFLDYLHNEFEGKTIITIDENDYSIDKIILNDCKRVNRLPPNEDGIENIQILIDIAILYTSDSVQHEQIVESITLLEEDETKEIISTEFNFDLK